VTDTGETFEPTLDVPDAWIEELAPAADLSLSRALVLSYGQSVLSSIAEEDFSLEQVQAALVRGVSLQRKQGDPDEYFLIASNEFAVFAKPSTGRRSGRPLAIVNRVTRSTRDVKARSVVRVPVCQRSPRSA
jgi:hypothetical protein